MASYIVRRKFLAMLGGAAATWPLAARAQQPGRVWRIGVLETTSMALNAANFEAFRQSLRDLGYIQEQNLIIEYRSAEGRGERFADLAADLLRLNVDLIVTRGTPAVLAAKGATTTTPIVMAAMGDPLMVVASAGIILTITTGVFPSNSRAESTAPRGLEQPIYRPQHWSLF